MILFLVFPAAPPASYGTQTKFLVSRLAQPPAGLGLYGKDFVCTLRKAGGEDDNNPVPSDIVARNGVGDHK
jgi:hypothetical protein